MPKNKNISEIERSLSGFQKQYRLFFRWEGLRNEANWIPTAEGFGSRVIISLSRSILSRNQMDKLHWSKKSKESKEWEQEIWAALHGKVPKASEPMIVKVTSIRKRLLDDDNLSGGFKGGRDALKRLGLIVDDNPKWVRFEYFQKTQKIGIGTIIEIIQNETLL